MSSVGLSHSWSSTSDSSTSPRRPLVSASACAFAFDTRVSAVSATARMIESRNRNVMAARIAQSAVVSVDGDHQRPWW